MNTDWRTLPTEDQEHERNGTPAPLPMARKLSELVRPTDHDPAELIEHRFLCRGGGALLAGPTGIGKSAFGLQCAVLWATGQHCMNISPAFPLRSLIIQAENDDGDLAEMRDGVLHGLEFTSDQTKVACESVLVCREDTSAGFGFFLECVRPLLAEHRPDLLWIDPALSYLGGESNSQKDVGAFLRNWLNPLLRDFNCGVIVVHHTNKPPSGREKPDWSGSDFAYLAAGSAEWANWARAVLAIRATGQQGVFELRAGKRGGRIGWREADGSPAFAKYIGHAKQSGVICWREVGADEVNTPGRPKENDASELLELLPDSGLTSTDWKRIAKEERGISERSFFRLLRRLEQSERILKTKGTHKWQPINKR